MKIQQTKSDNIKDQKNTDYITIYQNFKSLTNANSLNTTFLLGRGFDNLSKAGVIQPLIAKCFCTTKGNVARCVRIYKELLPGLNYKVVDSPSQAKAVRRATACVPSTISDQAREALSGDLVDTDTEYGEVNVANEQKGEEVL